MREGHNIFRPSPLPLIIGNSLSIFHRAASFKKSSTIPVSGSQILRIRSTNSSAIWLTTGMKVSTVFESNMECCTADRRRYHSLPFLKTPEHSDTDGCVFWDSGKSRGCIGIILWTGVTRNFKFVFKLYSVVWFNIRLVITTKILTSYMSTRVAISWHVPTRYHDMYRHTICTTRVATALHDLWNCLLRQVKFITWIYGKNILSSILDLFLIQSKLTILYYSTLIMIDMSVFSETRPGNLPIPSPYTLPSACTIELILYYLLLFYYQILVTRHFMITPQRRVQWMSSKNSS